MTENQRINQNKPYRIIDSGDRYVEYSSPESYQRYEGRIDKNRDFEEYLAIFKLSGIEVEKHWPLANGYWPDTPGYFSVSFNWILVKTKFGLIKMGWRKRVISISWSDTNIKAIVTDDDVTKEHYLVHACDSERAVHYMKNWREIAEKIQKEEGE